MSRPGPDGKVAHAAMSISGVTTMLECKWDGLDSRPPKKDGSSSELIYVYVDAALERVTSCGAKVLLPAKDQFWSDRMARIMDAQGHVWTLSSRIEETTLNERKERWLKLLMNNYEKSLNV